MADYKDIIAGTISSLAGKAKEIMDGVNEKGGVKEVYSQGISRAKDFAKVAKLTLEINGESEELKRVYTEIGKLYYEQTGGKADGFYTGLFRQVEEITAKIRDLDGQIETLKAESAEDTSGIEVEITEEPEEAPAPDAE